MPRTVTKKLMCPACQSVVADAAYTRWPGNLVLTSPAGPAVQPIGVALQIRVAEQDLEAAKSSVARGEAQVRLDYLRRHASELVYDLRCAGGGHRLVRSMPQIVRQLRSAPGSWVTLR